MCHRTSFVWTTMLSKMLSMKTCVIKPIFFVIGTIFNRKLCFGTVFFMETILIVLSNMFFLYRTVLYVKFSIVILVIEHIFLGGKQCSVKNGNIEKKSFYKNVCYRIHFSLMSLQFSIEISILERFFHKKASYRKSSL